MGGGGGGSGTEDGGGREDLYERPDDDYADAQKVYVVNQPEAPPAKPEKASTWSKVPKGPDTGFGLDYGGSTWGNSHEARQSRAFGSAGYTSKMQTHIKRPYYTAGLRLDKLIPTSFTSDFRRAAFQLANSTYDLATVVQFINEWGNFGRWASTFV